MFFYLSLFIIMIILAAADTSFFPNIFGFDAKPSALLAATVIWSVRNKYENIYLRSATAGLFLDIFSWGTVGPNILSFSAVSFLVGSLTKRFLPPQKTAKILTVSIFMVLATLIQAMISGFIWRFTALFSQNALPISLLEMKYLGLEIVFNLLILAVIFWPIMKLDILMAKDFKFSSK